VASVLRRVIGDRKAGPVFLRERFASELPPLFGDRRELERVCRDRQRTAGSSLSRLELSRIARGVWRDAGAIKPDAVRTSFVEITRAIGYPESTCPKSWRHTFATLLQDANVDPLIRQQTLGHRATTGVGLGMTANYTHTRRETQREQIEQALRRWPESLGLGLEFALREA
jgi:integrase